MTISMDKWKNLINKKVGNDIAFSLKESNPTDVKEWINTGSRILDSIICKGKIAGLPAGKVVELAGLPATGKSYLASLWAGQAQKQGYDVVYFDTESAIDSTFLTKLGVDVDKLLYLQPQTVEDILEIIEEMLDNHENKLFFIWDSLAFTSSKKEDESDFDPQTNMAIIPRILSLGFKKILRKLSKNGGLLLVLNQLKTNISTNRYEMMAEPYFTPGGKALTYAYSLRLWLTKSKSKSNFITDESGFNIGHHIKVTIKKSRFGTERRTCEFDILWADDNPRILDEKSWLEVVRKHPRYKGGSWHTLTYEDGTEEKFRKTEFEEKLKNEPKFRKEIIKMLDYELVEKFDKRLGKADEHYDLEEELDVTEEIETQ